MAAPCRPVRVSVAKRKGVFSMDTATVDTVTVQAKVKRSRFIIVAIAVCILLLAGVGLQWGKSSSAPTSDVLIRSSFSHVSYMTPEDARATREILEQRDQHELWFKWKLRCGCAPKYEIFFDNQTFAFSPHLNQNGNALSFDYYTVDSDGKDQYVTTYYISPYRDITFFHRLFLKYAEKDEDAASFPKEGRVFADSKPPILGRLLEKH